MASKSQLCSPPARAIRLRGAFIFPNSHSLPREEPLAPPSTSCLYGFGSLTWVQDSPLCVRLHFVRATSSLCGDLCQDALPVSGRVSCSVRMDLSGFLLPLSQDRWLFPRLAVGSGAVGTRVCCCLSKSGCVSQAPSVWKTQGLSLVLKTLTPGVQTAFAGRPPSGASWVVVLRPCHRPVAGGGT